MKSETPDSPDFESALAELEQILDGLEDGTTSLEESLRQYERGVALLRNCYTQLRDAEQRIWRLTGVDAASEPTLEPFEHVASLETVKRRDTGRIPRNGSEAP